MICAIFSGIVLFPSYFTHGCHPRRKSYQIWGNPIFIGTEATAGFQPLSCNCRWRERERVDMLVVVVESLLRASNPRYYQNFIG